MLMAVNFDFENKNFVLTGASGGLGTEIVREITEAGGKVLAIARDEEKLKKLLLMGEHRSDNNSKKVIIATADVRDYAAVENAVCDFVYRYGKIHGACHIAGTLLMTPLKAYNDTEAKALMDINFWSGIKLMQICTKRKYSEDGSSYLMISSVCAYNGEAAQFALNASKVSLQVAAKTLAKEIAKRGQRINTISPGLIMTELTKHDFDEKGISESTIDKHLLGLGTPQDISGMVCYLLSDRAKWITGQDFVIDGGYLASGR